MADQNAPQMQATLGLTGLTSNAMALIAPGAFLWLTFLIQATTGTTAPAMWLGIFAALLLCLATAVSYAEISKLYPGTGSSYYYAEQALLSKDKAFKYARVAKFIVGWGSHLYYWVYPGVMVATTGIFVGYIVGFLYPNFMSGSNPGPVFMALVAILFSFFVAGSHRRARAHPRPSTLPSMSSRSPRWWSSASWRSAIAPAIPQALGPSFQYDAQTLATYTYQFADRQGRHHPPRSSGGLCRCSTRPASRFLSSSTIPTQDASGNFLTHTNCRIGGLSAQIQLDVHSGHGRHSDPGGLRIGDLDGRRGQKSN